MARRKPNRSRRIVKKLLKRGNPHPNPNADAWFIDGGRTITGVEVVMHGLGAFAHRLAAERRAA